MNLENLHVLEKTPKPAGRKTWGSTSSAKKPSLKMISWCSDSLDKTPRPAGTKMGGSGSSAKKPVLKNTCAGVDHTIQRGARSGLEAGWVLGAET